MISSCFIEGFFGFWTGWLLVIGIFIGGVRVRRGFTWSIMGVFISIFMFKAIIKLVYFIFILSMMLELSSFSSTFHINYSNN